MSTVRQPYTAVSIRFLTGFSCQPVTITEPPFCNWPPFDFSCTFLILLSLRNYRDLGEMIMIPCLHFFRKTFCPLFIVITRTKFWTHLFAICGNAPSCRIQSPTAHCQNDVTSRSGKTEAKTRFGRLWSGEWKFLWRQQIILLHPRRSYSCGNFALIFLGTHI
jgi:hypothetical protein